MRLASGLRRCMQLRTRLAEFELKARNLEGLERERVARIGLADARLKKLLPLVDKISPSEWVQRIL